MLTAWNPRYISVTQHCTASSFPSSIGSATCHPLNGQPLSPVGISASGPPDRFLVSLAALALLGDIERTSPLIVVVDDAHWLDLDSVAALEFAGRRFVGDRMVVVCAVGEPLQDPPPFQWRELHLRGLDEDSAHQLLLSLAKAPVQRRVARELVVAAYGNPLALGGFVAELSPSQPAGRSPCRTPFPLDT